MCSSFSEQAYKQNHPEVLYSMQFFFSTFIVANLKIEKVQI